MLPAIGCGLRSTSASLWYCEPDAHSDIGRSGVAAALKLGPVGWLLVGAFVLWNGWALVLMAKNRTAVLPGGPTRTVLDRGPFRVSRNPLYLGLLALHAGSRCCGRRSGRSSRFPSRRDCSSGGAIFLEEQYLKVRFRPNTSGTPRGSGAGC